MNKKLVFSVMLVSLLALSLAFVSCDNGTTNPSGDGTGTFRIKITGIPESVMAAGGSGQILIGLFSANTTTYNDGDALAGRDTSLSADDDDGGSDWYEFSMYTLTSEEKYVGPAGNYDIAFFNQQASTLKVLTNKRLEVNRTNTLSYGDFVEP